MRLKSAWLLPATLLLLIVGFATWGLPALRHTGTQVACRAEAEHDAGAREESHARGPLGGLFSGPRRPETGCERPGAPESFGDMAQMNSAQVSRDVAPGTQVKAGAARAAARAAADLPQTGGPWQPYGNSPYLMDQTDYDTTRGSTNEGLGHTSGRATAFARSDSGTLYTAISNGGVWQSDDDAGSWHSIGDGLPTQVVSGVAWSSANGGTILVLTGDNAYGGDTYAGLGVYRSTDGGASWQRSDGVPDGVLGFRIVVDPNDPRKVYAATGGGLFRSTDGGQTFANVVLPTGANAPDGTPDCSGKPPTMKDCFLANMVTDVVVQGPSNANTSGAKPGAVMAAVGWRAGQKQNADGSQQSPGNGIYVSDTGAPGTFQNMDMAGNQQPNGGDPLTQDRIGRLALGIATGSDQDHNIVYALVQDAAKFNGQPGGLDANEPGGVTSAAASEYLNGVWVSTDFGATWKQLEGASTIDSDTTSGSALAPPTCKTPAIVAYCPGIQAWYNLWVQPDPTLSTAAGVPKRVAFGLEEVWANDPTQAPNGLDGSNPQKFRVIGRYYAGDNCTLFNTGPLPYCPAAQGGTVPRTTTHPDQHGVLFMPDGTGGVTLLVGNDGGVYKQHVASGADFSNDNWGTGQNVGLHTLQPYDAEMAKDGTVYMGLQDNGEGKIDPSGKSYSIYGGDGGFTAVNPDDPNVAYEEYTYGDISVTKDGGKTWTDIQPDNLASGLFTTPFQMDPNDANHLLFGGRDVEETTAGPDTSSSSWTKVFDLGTQKKPGDPNAGSDPTSDDGPDNQQSAMDVSTIPTPTNAPTGPKTADFSYAVPGSTYPAAPSEEVGGPPPPGSYDDHDFTIGPNDGDAALHVLMTWADAQNDWDVYLYKVAADGTETEVASGTNSQGSAPIIQGGADAKEEFSVPNPEAGNYRLRVVNFSADPSDAPNVSVKFDQRQPGVKLQSDTAYVAYCGYCDTITQGTPFANGIATNVGGDKPGVPLKPDGWHIAKAAGLPSRYITSIRIDPTDPNTVYATLAGYGRRWAFPGAVGEDTSKIGTGHVFKSTDAGASFKDVSGDLPDAPANWTVLHDNHIVVGTDIGVFESCDLAGTAYSRLGSGLPAVPIATLRLKPGDPDTLVAATYGRGVYTYHFDKDEVKCPPPTSQHVLAAEQKGALACTAQRQLFGVSVKPRGHGLRLSAKRHNPPIRYTVDVFKQASGSRVLAPKPVAVFGGKRGTVTWSGKPTIRGRKVTDGYYFARFGLKLGALGDVRRIALARSNGRWHLRRDFDYHSACRIVRLFKLSGPTFAGRRLRPLGISFRMALPGGSAKLVVKQGKKTVKRATFAKPGTSLVQIKLPAKRLRRGDYRVMLTAKLGVRSQRLTLLSRRL